jgi:hypothetical protein
MINAAVFGAMLVGECHLRSQHALMGRQPGTRTTNGEWWRLVTSVLRMSGCSTIITMAVLSRLAPCSSGSLDGSPSAPYLSAGVFTA